MAARHRVGSGDGGRHGRYPDLDVLVELFFSRTVLPLRFIMSLQNAIVTKISQSEIRTVHMTGVITDQLIELRPMASWNRHCGDGAPVRADRDRMSLLATILGLFLAGGLFFGGWRRRSGRV